jgi:hypothetical protein
MATLCGLISAAEILGKDMRCRPSGLAELEPSQSALGRGTRASAHTCTQKKRIPSAENQNKLYDDGSSTLIIMVPLAWGALIAIVLYTGGVNAESDMFVLKSYSPELCGMHTRIEDRKTIRPLDAERGENPPKKCS